MPAPTIIIRDAGNCYVNGVNVGSVVDAIANNVALSSAIESAFVAYQAEQDAENGN